MLPRYKELCEKFKYVAYVPPKHLYPAWRTWKDIRRTLTMDQSITYQHIHAYLTIMDSTLQPCYIELLLEYDDIFRIRYYEIQEQIQARKNKG